MVSKSVCPYCQRPITVNPSEENAVVTHYKCSHEKAAEIRERVSGERQVEEMGVQLIVAGLFPLFVFGYFVFISWMLS